MDGEFGTRPGANWHVLVVDDSKAQRRILTVQLSRWGYRVTEAASGEEALELCRTTSFDMVLSDWVMPGMSGVELCRAFRDLPREGYGYFILLTSKSEKAEVADGLQSGADDFLTKPVSSDELRGRLRAGERILGMQAELVEKNRLVNSTLAELQGIYDSLDRDLIEARKLQQTLVRDRYRAFDGGAVSVMMLPSGHVGGDLVGSFLINPRCLVVYSIDVSGHGVASAMMTARLAGLLAGGAPGQNITMSDGGFGRADAWPPEMVAFRLNKLMTEVVQVDQYFTMVYAEIDLQSGNVRLVQAGHPHPVVLRADGRVDVIGAGGLPVGLVDGARYDRVNLQLRPGDRLFLVSDGVTECPDPMGVELETQGMIGILNRSLHLGSPELLEALIWDLTKYHGTPDFPDDISGILFDFNGPA
ncbi:MAG: PP2C family protein-serine/threonine phosphatase [Paracoccaceae bacterium]